MAEKRSIFEEVGDTPKAAPKGGMIDARPQGARKAIRAWLIVLFVMVVSMIVVGGLTRLTDSGLSITEWRQSAAPCRPCRPKTGRQSSNAISRRPNSSFRTAP